ncbi:MAG: 5-(carboxyamino)imidazole ribonucleotide synthase [Burkholderiaceae bacterium]
MTHFIAPGATLGVMGGGQLGRMFVHAAQRLGYRTAVLDPDPASPAGLIAHHHLCTDYLDAQGLAQLAQCSAAITTEFENVPAHALVTLAAQRPVAPGAQVVAICQDRAAEKAHFKRCGIECAAFALLETPADLTNLDDALFPGILKTAQLGYDGKGQMPVKTRADLAGAWRDLGGVRCVIEQRLDLALELSIIVARNAQGEAVHFSAQHNLHRAGILAVTLCPAPQIPAALEAQAVKAALRLAQQMQYVGVLCVEFFVLQDGRLLANEMAPRPHNSGHATIDSCDVSQFELQVRALTGAPLTAPRQHSPAVLLNLMGDLWFSASESEAPPDWASVLELPGAHLHLYGKTSPRRGRKMGHLTLTAATAAQAHAKALQAAQRLGIEAF